MAEARAIIGGLRVLSIRLAGGEQADHESIIAGAADGAGKPEAGLPQPRTPGTSITTSTWPAACIDSSSNRRMNRTASHCIFFIAAGLMTRSVDAQSGVVFVSRPGQVIKLMDINGDGDFLDFAEQSVFADSLPLGLDRITALGGRLFVGATNSAEVFVMADLNADGDAMDFGEVMLYGQIAPSMPAPALAGLASAADGTLFAGDRVAGKLYAFVDANGDGDALDFAETLVVAEGLSVPTAVAVRPDGAILVAQNDATIPVRILQDRNGDGDFLDFAENLSYVENVSPGADIAAATDTRAFVTRTAAGEVIVLRDLNGDNDSLDVGEVASYAAGLDAPLAVTSAGSGGLFVAAFDAAGTIYQVRDANGDGDALDFAEVVPVAAGVNQPTGIAFLAASAPGCLKGDVNHDTVVDINDVGPFVQILLCDVAPADPCPADVNNDGVIDGGDIAAFINALLF